MMPYSKIKESEPEIDTSSSPEALKVYSPDQLHKHQLHTVKNANYWV